MSTDALEPTPSKGASVVEQASGFFAGVRTELEKVTWPSKPELIRATRMIVTLSVVLGIVIGLLDYVLQLILVDGVARLGR